MNEHKDKNYATANIKTINDIYNETQSLTGGAWSPPTTDGRVYSNFGKTVANDARKIQQTSYGTQTLLQDYVKAKFGEENSAPFWKTVESKGYNYPTIADFKKAVKQWEKIDKTDQVDFS